MPGITRMKGALKPPFRPTDLADLTLWLDGVDPNFLDLTVSDEVTGWLDKSGQGNDLTQATTANKPIYSLSNLAVEYSTASHRLDITSLLGVGGQSARSMFFVLNPTVLSVNDVILQIASTVNANAFRMKSNLVFTVNGQGAGFIPGMTTGVKQILYVSNDTSEQVQDIDVEINRSVSINNSSSATTIDISGTTSTLGNRFSGSNAFVGGISEVVIYARDLPVSEKNQGYTYLERKYGI